MKLTSIIADDWKYDGGISFGVVPKSLWSRSIQADENNKLHVVDRCLLIENEGRRILIDAGMGRKREEKYYRYRFVNQDVDIEKSLGKAGLSTDDITDVLFTHLHDDHVGGATSLDYKGNSIPVFKNAAFWCSKSQWEWAMHPNIRETVSYYPDNLLPLSGSGRLNLIEEEGEIFPGISVRITNGHTRGHLVPVIDTGSKTLAYMGDFIPTIYHLPLTWLAAVDIQPLLAYPEKDSFLKESLGKNYFLYFEHDCDHEICTLRQTEKGISFDKILTLHEFTS